MNVLGAKRLEVASELVPNAQGPCWSTTTTPTPKLTPWTCAQQQMPLADGTINPETRVALLEAIAKARLWIDDLVKGRAQSLAEIAHREGKVERHIRLLAPLAFVSPQVILAVLDGVAPPSKLNITSVAAALPYLWTEQMRRFGCSHRIT
jgi:hypothetical protein